MAKLKNKKIVVDKDKDVIKFAIHSPLLKQAFEYEVRKLNGISNGSFSKHVVSINQETFTNLLVALYGDLPLPDNLKDAINTRRDVKVSDNPTLIRLFIEEFIKTSGNKMTEVTIISPSYSATRTVMRQQIVIEKQVEDKFETVLFLPEGEARQGEGGLRTQGCFKTRFLKYCENFVKIRKHLFYKPRFSGWLNHA